LDINKNGRKVLTQFTSTEAIAITNFFFTEVMGPETYTRVANIAQYYNTNRSPDNISQATAVRAALLANDETIPGPLKSFYASFSLVHRLMVNTNTNYGSLIRTISTVDLYNKWQGLRKLARKGNANIIEFLNKQGLYTRPGVDLHSLVNQYLSNALGFGNNTNTLQNTCQAAQGISYLIEQFGDGIVIFLPTSASTRFVMPSALSIYIGEILTRPG
jgi:hypothetical protein